MLHFEQARAADAFSFDLTRISNVPKIVRMHHKKQCNDEHFKLDQFKNVRYHPVIPKPLALLKFCANKFNN